MLAVPILIIVVVVAVVLRYGFGINETYDDISPTLTAQEIQDLVLPDEDVIALYFSSQFEAEPTNGEQVTMIARDGEQTFGYMSKGTTVQPEAIIILVHDSPSSTRAAKELDATLGKRIASQFNAVTVSVDWRDGVYGEDDVSDVLAAVNWANEYNNELRPVDIYMVGIGHGAYLAAKVMEETDKTIEETLAINGYYYPLREYVRLQSSGESTAEAFLLATGCSGEVYPNTCLDELGIISSSSISSFEDITAIGNSTEDIIQDSWSAIRQWLPIEQKTIVENPSLGEITQ